MHSLNFIGIWFNIQFANYGCNQMMSLSEQNNMHFGKTLYSFFLLKILLTHLVVDNCVVLFKFVFLHKNNYLL